MLVKCSYMVKNDVISYSLYVKKSILTTFIVITASYINYWAFENILFNTSS